MEKSKNRSKQIIEIILITIILFSVGLVMVEMGTNLSNEIISQEPRVTTVKEVQPIPAPTLTAEEKEDLFSAPVGEDN